MTETTDDALSKLPPRRRAFVENYTNPASPTFGNATQSLVSAGASDHPSVRVTASQTLASPNVQEAVRERLNALYAADGGPEKWAHEHLKRFASDSDAPWKRSPAVRAVELVMRATGQLAADTQVTVDARSILLPAASALSVADLEGQLRALERAEAEVTDALSG